MSKSRFLFVGAVLAALLTGCRSVQQHQPEVTYRYGVPVRQAILDPNEYNLAHKYGPKFEKVDYITIHNTWNYAPALFERTYLNNRRDGASISFHFAVDEKEALQVLPLDTRAWHAGDGNGPGNGRSIGIEICRSRCIGDDEPLYRQAEENGAHLAASLLDQYQLPMSCLRKHQDWTGKYCPHRILSEHRWESFKAHVKQIRNEHRIDAAKSVAATTPVKPAAKPAATPEVKKAKEAKKEVKPAAAKAVKETATPKVKKTKEAKNANPKAAASPAK
ncbi:MAG: N-acetylmuramoyl-L-alanine amidase [Victivallales bacterium]|nr:N-acetylmuramoyl-L-alanine amidase [Victivallales bacterium]